VRIGLALPQYDFSVPGENPLRWETLLGHAQRAEGLGFHSLWVSDHLFLDIEKYGGAPGRHGVFEPIVTLAALGRAVPGVRLGTLVVCEALRPPGVLAKLLAGLDQACGGRLDVGLGAGWYEPEYRALGMDIPGPGVRLARLEEALDILIGLLGGGPFTYRGRYHGVEGAVNLPAARQVPRPRLFLGGSGDRLLGLVAAKADGWNTVWVWKPKDYEVRLAVLEQRCDEVGRDPTTVHRSLGLYTLVGEDTADLERRFARLRDRAPDGVLGGVGLEQWREGRLVGTVEQVREQVAEWEALGVEELVVCPGPLPFSVTADDELEQVAAALL
jgi:alkanesulfonate monooxygenase SsuD/methylene tetrahydromethanopterin reductase-like flavin-dependent oxidoreductase (luciferase family)